MIQCLKKCPLRNVHHVITLRSTVINWLWSPSISVTHFHVIVSILSHTVRVIRGCPCGEQIAECGWRL